MPPFISIGLAAGVATAALFASASAGGMTGRILLFFLAPLPCYLAGLGWGAASAAIAAVVSALGAGVVLGARTGAIFFLSQGLPLILLCRLALLNRPSAVTGPAMGGSLPGGVPSPASGSQSGTAPILEWYPPGRIVAAATLIAGGLAFLSILMIGYDLEQLRALMREMVEKVLLKQFPGLGGGKLGEAEIIALTELMVHALPAASAVVWLGGFLLNLWLAGKITLLSGRLARPWPDVTTMRYPRGFGLGLAASLALTMLSGLPALLASAFSGAFFFAYLLMGLAIIHYVTLGLTARPFILWGVYVALFVLNTWAGLVIALIAVMEPLLPWRRPPDVHQSGPRPPGG